MAPRSTAAGCRTRQRSAESSGAAELRDGIFTCKRCYRDWPLRDGVPQLCDEDRVSGIDVSLREDGAWLRKSADGTTPGSGFGDRDIHVLVEWLVS